MEGLKILIASVVLAIVLTFSYLQGKKEQDFDPFLFKIKSSNIETNLKKINQNKIILIYFGFLNCPNICPMTFATMTSVFKDLSPSELEKIAFLFVDLDPERDTDEKIIKYLSNFHSNAIPIRLSLPDLKLFTKAFGVQFKKVPVESQMQYTIDHSTDIIVIGKNGKILAPIKHEFKKTAIIAQLKEIL